MDEVKRFFRALPNGLRCAALIVLGIHAMAANAEADAPRISLPGHVLPLIAQATPGLAVATLAKSARMSEPLTLTVVLRRSNPTGFAAYLEDVYDRGSPNFRHFLSPAQVSERFGPSVDDYTPSPVISPIAASYYRKAPPTG